MQSYPLLFSNFTSRRLDLKNRAVVLAHGTGMVRDGIATDEDIAYWERLAEAGAGMMITGGITVHPTGTLRQRNRIEAYAEEAQECLQKRCDAMHRHGVVLLGQLTHLGRESTGGDSDFPALAPSPVRSPRDLFPPHELDPHEIADIVHGYCTTARNLKRAGYDGIEIHGAHGYLVAQFLSPATNRRTDAYGGSEEKRLRFLREIIESIRTDCGDDFVISLRLSADEEIADGLGIADSVRISRAVAALDAVDVLNVTLGVRGNYVKDASTPKGIAARAAKMIREACDLPVIVGQRITTPELAESILAAGAADLVGMARAFIADREWLHKAARGEARRIRPCLGLNQDCRAFSPVLHCAVNPAAGRETMPGYGIPGTTVRPRKIAVIGAGPGGLEAARVAAQRGHRVTVYEATDSIGGQFIYAAAIPNRSELIGFIDYQRSELAYLAVSIETQARITKPDELTHPADTVILATGARALPVGDEFRHRNVMSWFDVLAGGAPPPCGARRAVLIDDGSGFWWTYGVAEALAVAGWRLVIATPSSTIANNIPQESVSMLLSRLGRAGSEYRVLTMLEQVGDDCALLANITSGETEQLLCDLVVIQTGRVAEPGPLTAFRSARVETYCIGDCVSPRRMSHAVFEGYSVACRL